MLQLAENLGEEIGPPTDPVEVLLPLSGVDVGGVDAGFLLVRGDHFGVVSEHRHLTAGADHQPVRALLGHFHKNVHPLFPNFRKVVRDRAAGGLPGLGVSAPLRVLTEPLGSEHAAVGARAVVPLHGQPGEDFHLEPVAGPEYVLQRPMLVDHKHAAAVDILVLPRNRVQRHAGKSCRVGQLAVVLDPTAANRPRNARYTQLSLPAQEHVKLILAQAHGGTEVRRRAVEIVAPVGHAVKGRRRTPGCAQSRFDRLLSHRHEAEPVNARSFRRIDGDLVVAEVGGVDVADAVFPHSANQPLASHLHVTAAFVRLGEDRVDAFEPGPEHDRRIPPLSVRAHQGHTTRSKRTKLPIALCRQSARPLADRFPKVFHVEIRPGRVPDEMPRSQGRQPHDLGRGAFPAIHDGRTLTVAGALHPRDQFDAVIALRQVGHVDRLGAATGVDFDRLLNEDLAVRRSGHAE